MAPVLGKDGSGRKPRSKVDAPALGSPDRRRSYGAPTLGALRTRCTAKKDSQRARPFGAGRRPASEPLDRLSRHREGDTDLPEPAPLLDGSTHSGRLLVSLHAAEAPRTRLHRDP